MKKGLHFWHIPTCTELYYKFRTTGISQADAQEHNIRPFQGGIEATELGAIMGLNSEGRSAMEIYHNKVGSYPIVRESEEVLFYKRKNERYMSDLWKSWDGTCCGYTKNYNECKFLRGITNDFICGFVNNPDYPHLYCSLDYLGQPGGFHPVTGDVHKDYFPLDFFVIQDDKKVKSIPQDIIVRMTTKMMITDTNYCEIGVLCKDHFSVHQLNRNEKLCDDILKKSKAFWDMRVLPARNDYKLAEQSKGVKNIEDYERRMKRIGYLEPEPFGFEIETKWLSKRHNPVGEVMIKGSLEHYRKIRELVYWQKVYEYSAESYEKMRVSLAQEVVNQRANGYDFGNKGIVEYSENDIIEMMLMDMEALEMKIQSEFGVIEDIKNRII